MIDLFRFHASWRKPPPFCCTLCFVKAVMRSSPVDWCFFPHANDGCW